MKRVKYEAPRHTKRGAGGKTVALLLALMLVVCGVIGGTVAWLTDTTETVQNVFTTSDIDIDLTETERTYQMVPGYTLDKDPKVTVKANSEKCYLFVKVEESTTLKDYIEYTMADGWTQLKNGDTDVTGVFYREVAASTTDQDFNVLKDNKVTVKSTVTKKMMDDLKAEGATQPTLTFTAYAIQFNTSNNTSWTSPYAAWTEISGSSTPTT